MQRELPMTDRVSLPLGPGDRAPDFDLPAADHEGRISLSDCYRRGPVLLLLLRGLYCAFCRRQISQLKSTCDLLQGAGISLLGVVIASAERSRLYFKFGARPCCPLAAAPDRSVHSAYGLPAVVRTPELMAPIRQRAAEVLRAMNVESGSDPLMTLHHDGGWADTPEDDAEFKRPLQSIGYYLIDRQGVIRWASVGEIPPDLPGPESLLALV
ncbi:MAG TPA: redoxin domain-containing protein [Methylomirabilota bacterium]